MQVKVSINLRNSTLTDFYIGGQTALSFNAISTAAFNVFKEDIRLQM